MREESSRQEEQQVKRPLGESMLESVLDLFEVQRGGHCSKSSVRGRESTEGGWRWGRLFRALEALVKALGFPPNETESHWSTVSGVVI